MGMSNTNAGFLSPGRGHVGGSAGSRRGSERGRGHERRPSRHGSDRGRSQKVGDRAGAAATTWAAAHEPYLSLIAPSLVAGVPPDGEVADATRRCCCSPDVGYPGCAPRAVAATAGPRQRRARDLRRGGGALPRHRGLEEVGARGWGFEIEGLAMRGDDHHEAAFAVDVVKDLAPPEQRNGPLPDDAGLHRRRQQLWVDDEQRGAGVGTGAPASPRSSGSGSPSGPPAGGSSSRRKSASASSRTSGSRWPWGLRCDAVRYSTPQSDLRRLAAALRARREPAQPGPPLTRVVTVPDRGQS